MGDGGKLREPNFSFLLIGLLITLLAGPLSAELFARPGGLTVQIAFSATVIVSIWSLHESRYKFVLGILLALAMIISTAIDAFRPSVINEAVAFSSMLLFCGLSLVFTARHVLVGDQINGNRLVGAICVYLLLGFGLSVLNMIVNVTLPGSFKGMSAALGRGGLDLIYYTFVTMTTLGYGDITPVRPLARALAYLAAVAGQFYIAILVGGLVGIYLTRQQRD